MSVKVREERVSSKEEWPLVKSENSYYYGMGNEWESGKHSECYLPFQRFCVKSSYNCSGYKLGLDQTIWDQILSLPFVSFVTVSKLLNLPLLLFSI